MVKWYLVWIVLTPQADGSVDWTITQEAKDSEDVCVEAMWEKNDHFEAIKLEDPQYSWALFCTNRSDGQLNEKFKLDSYRKI